MDASTNLIFDQLLQVINKIIFLEKRRVVRVGEDALYPSEIHLLLVIKDRLASNISEIARRLGVTKGAISQTVDRLHRKGILRKERDTTRKNELVLSLTAKGRRAYQLCLQSKQEFLEAHGTFIETLDEREQALILGFLRHMAAVLDASAVTDE